MNSHDPIKPAQRLIGIAARGGGGVLGIPPEHAQETLADTLSSARVRGRVA